MIIFTVEWDINDARFFYYDNMIVSNIEEWKQKVKEKCLKNKEQLMSKYEFDKTYWTDTENTCNNFEEWVNWCIEMYAYYHIKKIDDYS